MRVGVLIRPELEELRWAAKLGFRSVEFIRFHQSPAVERDDWKPFVDELAAEAKTLDIRISAIGALYQNPLHPKQEEFARRVFHRAIDVAAHIGTKTVAGFPGAVIETSIHEQGGNPVYRGFEHFIPQLLKFWEPVCRYAEDRGVRIAFEHCPQGPFHLPLMHYNMFGQPAIWEKVFDAARAENLGLEWDASHLVCQFIDPIANIHKFGSRIFHVHAKDAFVNPDLLRTYGICHPGVAEHRFPGLGQSNWAEIVHALVRAGYDSDLNIEGRHDPVFRNHAPTDSTRLAGKQLEEDGLLIGRRILEQYIPRV